MQLDEIHLQEEILFILLLTSLSKNTEKQPAIADAKEHKSRYDYTLHFKMHLEVDDLHEISLHYCHDDHCHPDTQIRTKTEKSQNSHTHTHTQSARKLLKKHLFSEDTERKKEKERKLAYSK